MSLSKPAKGAILFSARIKKSEFILGYAVASSNPNGLCFRLRYRLQFFDEEPVQLPPPVEPSERIVCPEIGMFCG